MSQWNVLRNKHTGSICVVPFKDGLSDSLFEAGVRIHEYGLTFNQLEDFKRGNDYLPLQDFMTEATGEETREPGRAWKGHSNHFDSLFDSSTADKREVY